MRYGSICSGVEAAALAWKNLGWTPVFFSEVEPFPSAVLCHKLKATRPLRPLDPANAGNEKDRKQRECWQNQLADFPKHGDIPNLGDFTLIKESDYDEKIDLLVGGFPCQSYSLAGLRKGLADPRGNLAIEFVKLAYRSGARWLVGENVPGLLSSGAGQDFAVFLSEVCGWEVPVPKGGWGKCGIVTNAPGCFGVAWRILDAQYTRVPAFPRAIPQRRRRLFIVGYRSQPVGNPIDWQYPATVLFDGEMRKRDTPPRRTKGKRAPARTEGGIGTSGEHGLINLIPYGMRLGAHEDGVAATIAKIDAKFPQCVCWDEESPELLRMREGCSGGGKGPLISRDLSLTLATSNDQTLLEKKIVWWNGENKADTITCTSNNQLMPDKKKLQCVIDMRQVEVVERENVSPTLIATDYKGGKAVMEGTEAVCYENHGNDSRITECGDV